MHRRIQRVLAIFFLVFFIAHSLHAASEHSGRVTLGGQPVPGARVTASQGSQSLATSTDRNGVYRFPALAEGVWAVRVEMLGFSTLTRDVTIGATPAQANWELTVLPFGDITRGIPPSPPPAAPENPARRRSASREPAQATGAAAPTAGGAFQRAGVTATPAAAGRPTPAPAPAAPVAGPAPGGPGEPGAAAPSASGDSFLVSGTVNSGTLPQPTLGNVRRPTGIRLFNGQISVSPHYSALEASPHSLTGVPAQKPNTTSLSVNSTVFGPWRIPGLMRNPRQFNVSFRRQSTENANTLSERMPTELQRSGDFSQSLNGFGQPVQIVDPLTGLPFEGNVIPPDRISPQAAYLLGFYPLPDPEATGTRNYQIAALSANSSDAFNGSLPNLISNNTNQVGFSGGYTRSRSESTSLFGFDSTNEGSGYNASANWAHRWVPSNQQVRFTYSYNRQTNTSTPYFANRINVSGEAGITGNNQTPFNWGPPGLSFASGIAGLSDAQFSLNRTQTHTLGATSNRTRGRHNMTYGGNFRYQLLDVVSQQNPRGSFTFSGSISGDAFADFLLGLPNTSAIANGNPDKGYRGWGYDAYLSDDFRVNPSFTITMGVRWEYEAPVIEHLGRLVNLDVTSDFSAAAPVIAADGVGPVTGLQYPKSLIEPDPFGLLPRIGVAWRPVVTSSVVLRAGYGIYRNTGVYQGFATQMAQQPPLSTTFNATSTLQTPLTLANGFIAPIATTLNTVAVDPEFRVGTVHRWQASAQRDLPGAFTITGTYQGGKGVNLPQAFIPNTYPGGAANPCPTCPTGFIYTTSHGRSIQHSGQVQLRRRLRAGVTWQAGYTLMKASDNASSFGGGGGGQAAAQDWLDLDAEWGPSSFEQRHQFVLQATYATGQGVSGGTLAPGLRGALLKNWQITANLTTGSGMPRTPTYRVTSVAGITGTVRPDLTGAPLDDIPDGYYANPTAFAPPSLGTWGNAGRNSIRGPSQFTLNAGISRSFPIQGRLSLNWNLNATNVLNRVTFSSINTVVGSPEFGLPTATNPMRRITTNISMNF